MPGTPPRYNSHPLGFLLSYWSSFRVILWSRFLDLLFWNALTFSNLLCLYWNLAFPRDAASPLGFPEQALSACHMLPTATLRRTCYHHSMSASLVKFLHSTYNHSLSRCHQQPWLLPHFAQWVCYLSFGLVPLPLVTTHANVPSSILIYWTISCTPVTFISSWTSHSNWCCLKFSYHLGDACLWIVNLGSFPLWSSLVFLLMVSNLTLPWSSNAPGIAFILESQLLLFARRSPLSLCRLYLCALHVWYF